MNFKKKLENVLIGLTIGIQEFLSWECGDQKPINIFLTATILLFAGLMKLWLTLIIEQQVEL